MTTEQQIQVLTASIETIEFKLKSLSDHVSYLQVRAWKKQKKKFKNLLRGLKEVHKKEKQNAINPQH